MKRVCKKCGGNRMKEKDHNGIEHVRRIWCYDCVSLNFQFKCESHKRSWECSSREFSIDPIIEEKLHETFQTNK